MKDFGALSGEGKLLRFTLLMVLFGLFGLTLACCIAITPTRESDERLRHGMVGWCTDGL